MARGVIAVEALLTTCSLRPGVSSAWDAMITQHVVVGRFPPALPRAYQCYKWTKRRNGEKGGIQTC
jgi:hypothetical protein